MVRKVMIIRHAEKPVEHGGGPIGVTLDGLRDDHDLVPRGWQRAGALATLFAASAQTGAAPIERPDTLVAAGVNAASRSRRAQSTIGPTAEKLALPTAVITAFCPGNEAALARHIHDAGGDVWLICWEHKHIQDIVAEITAGTVRAPHWSGSRFDVIFVLDKGPEGWRLQQVPQMLLAGDLETSVAEKSLTAKADDA